MTMKKTLNSILSITLSLVMLLMFLSSADLSFFASATVVDSGKCGDNLTWSLDSDGNLTIEGTGDMDSWDSFVGLAPWIDCDSEIFEVVITDGVTNIGDCAFYDCSSLTSIKIPDSVTSIGDWAFYDCSNLTGITIPNGTTSIGDHTFEYCSKLTTVIIPYGVTIIGYATFSNCSGLTYIKIPDSVTRIGDNAFSGCASLASVTIPDSVISVGNYAFYDCSSLTSIKISDSITSIENYVFDSCTSLTSVIIPASVTSIGKMVFDNCTGLARITVDKNNQHYSSDEFGVLFNKNKTRLMQFPAGSSAVFYDIPDSVMSIDSCAFYNCISLTEITVDKNNQHYSSDEFGVLFNKDKTRLITFPAGSAIVSYDVPDSVTVIEYAAFLGCFGLTSVTIPDSVTKIADRAFANCDNLVSITFYNPEIEIYGYWSDTIPYKTIIYGYVGSTAQEYAENYDREFAVIQEHTHSYTSKETTQPTCAKEGVKTFTCSCGDSYTEAIAKLATHTWGEWKVTKAATYEAECREERSCSVCKKTEGKVISKLEYKEIEITVTEEVKPLGEDAVLVLSDASVGEIIKNTKGNVSVTDKDGKAVSEKDSVASGMTVTLKDSAGKVIDEKTIVVPGDNNGDGKISAADARSALRASVSLDKLNTWQTSASNVYKTAENKITAADARFILRASVGLEKFSEWIKTLK